MVLSYLFYILLFIFPLGQLDRFDIGNGIVLHLTDIAVFFAVMFWAITLIRQKRTRDIVSHPYFKPIILFILICVFSLVFNTLKLTTNQLIISSLYAFRWAAYAAIFFIMYRFPGNVKRRIIFVLIFTQALLLIFGYIQYFLYPNLRNLYYLGWDEHLYRMFSTFLDPNFFAVQINLFILFLLGHVLKPVKRQKRDTIISIMLIVFAFIGLLLTYSRSGFLMLAAGSTILLLLFNKKHFVIAFLVVLAIGILALPKNLHSAGVELWRTASINARSISAIQAISIIKDNPVFGIGFNTYRYAQKKYGYIDPKTWEISHSGAGTDNSFLFIIATTGIVGVGLYLYLVIIIGRRVWSLYRRGGGQSYALAAVIISSAGGLLINSFFINSLFYPYVMFWMWTLLGLLEKEEQK